VSVALISGFRASRGGSLGYVRRAKVLIGIGRDGVLTLTRRRGTPQRLRGGRRLVSRRQRRTRMFLNTARVISATRNQGRTNLGPLIVDNGIHTHCPRVSRRRGDTPSFSLPRRSSGDTVVFWLVRPGHPNGGNRSLGGRSRQSAPTAVHAP